MGGKFAGGGVSTPLYAMDTQIDPEFFHNKLIYLEDRTRRNDLKIYGVRETNDETWEKCEEHVNQVVSEKLGLKNIRAG